MASANGLRPLSMGLAALRIQPTTARTFTTTSARCTKTIQPHKIPPPLAPAYPPGESLLYKQSNRGLYGGARITFGDRISGRNKIRTPRTWKPNVHRKKLWSESLGAWVKTRLTTRVYRTIKKEGGLDEYLVAPKKRRVEELGPAGWRLRWLVMQTERMQDRFRKEREALGLKPKEETEDDAILRKEKVQIAMDYATPGGLSRSTRDILAKRTQMLEEEFAIGEGNGNDNVEFKVVEVDGDGKVIEETDEVKKE
ncbi:hypothetical protein VUR80DRAFT_7199 [Thermomyces stellatus]